MCSSWLLFGSLYALLIVAIGSERYWVTCKDQNPIPYTSYQITYSFDFQCMFASWSSNPKANLLNHPETSGFILPPLELVDLEWLRLVWGVFEHIPVFLAFPTTCQDLAFQQMPIYLQIIYWYVIVIQKSFLMSHTVQLHSKVLKLNLPWYLIHHTCFYNILVLHQTHQTPRTKA